MRIDEYNDMLANIPEAQWVREMREHYARKGWYRPEDLRRLLGSPTDSFQMETEETVDRYFRKP